MSDEGKTNKNGRIDEHGAFRHHLPELCPIGAIAIHLFAYFHIENNPCPKFAPDFNHPQASAMGYRDWYKLRLFPSSKGLYTEMSYESKFIFNHLFMSKYSDPNWKDHRQRVNRMKMASQIICQKVTHCGRIRAAENGSEFGSTTEGIKALGVWSQGAMRSCYDRKLPVDGLLATAGFNGRKHESYFLARDNLGKIFFPVLVISSN